MTFLRSLLVCLTMILIVVSCRKEYSSEDNLLTPVIEESWEFTESGILFSGPVDTAYVQSISSVSTLSVIGTKTGGEPGEMFLQVVGEEIKKGTYNSPAVFFQYSENGSVIYQSSASPTDNFTITITELDSTFVSGTYSGTIQDAEGNKKEITNGKFRSKVAFETDDPDPVTSGSLTVWTKELCSDGGPVEVMVNEQYSQIADAFTSEPDCEAAGTAVFTLLTGTYELKAVCGTDTVTYQVTINEGCNKLEVDLQSSFDQYLPLTLGSKWTYADVTDVSTTEEITADAEAEFDGRNYTRLVSNLADTFYYRKAGNVYYEYKVLNFQGYVDDPTSVEIEILHSEFATGQSWESVPADIVLSGVPVKVKLVSTIANRDFTSDYNGVTYSNLIEVETEILFSADGGNSYQSSGSGYTTIFAKDFGIVFYDDIDRNLSWGIQNIMLNP